ncbi:glycoside hydrolase family 79 protein [Paxillus rubicundulus Ve08.2h10]|uniref:Glycoside hydrolase family 79 protein n=1 Tax=Paxillus rubicundulus Ve08.2h10 TaxID=930991 RepID=A0A0D0DAX5_9AGAM|nr:glycoside hydrolase family 79 protein [Paxillus rubicundulus Ve08.2h10]
MRLLVHSFLLAIGIVQATVTVYGPHVQQPLGTVTAASASYTGAASYNDIVLTPPPVPSPPPPASFNVELQTGGVPGLSIPQHGSFFGFSVEFSVVTQVLGLNSSFLQVPFLNLMANLRERAGSVHVRLGGNTQDYATLVSSTSDGAALEKYYDKESNPTDTPPLVFTSEIIKMMAGISALTNARWYLGIPFNDTQNWRLQIAEVGESILGDYLVGLQAGNEPDLYAAHGHRPDDYSPDDYKDEFGDLIDAMNDDSRIPIKDLLIGPNLAGVWKPDDVWNTGFATDFNENLAALAVERYPTDNCYAQFGTGTPRTGQEMLPTYLTHKSGQQIVSEYLDSTVYAQTVGKPFLMFETNTASCGGFPGLSDSFTAALWAVDYALQMAYVNFTNAMFHVGGQSVYYNPFTPPVTNQSTFHQWTIGPVYYSALFVAEALGPSNKSQVLDLQMNGGNEFTPGYAIYENGQPTRLALINFVNDASGANDYTASISIAGATPAQVKVKYLSAASVVQKYNFTWAGQTFGDVFSSDGRPVGAVDIQTVDCDQSRNVCDVKVPAPGAALVFLSDQALVESDQGPTMTFPTTAYTKLHNTATIDPSVLATSNGGKGLADSLAGTSKGGINGSLGLAQALPSLGALIVGVLLVARMTT